MACDSWKDIKRTGEWFMNRKGGGSPDLLDVRPLKDLHGPILRYCIKNAVFLPTLRQALWDKLSQEWQDQVMEETKIRVQHG
jgi:hypothetical protein